MKSCCNYKWNMYTKAYGKQTWMILFLFIGQCFCAVSISQSNMITNKGGIINLVATTDEAGVTWTYKGGTSLTICSTGSAACIPTSILEMNFSANSSSATIAIASLNCSIHSGTYIASTTLDMASLTIDVTTPVSSISSKTSLTTSKVSSQELLVEVQCVYPKSAIAANFTVHRTGKPVDILIPDSKEPNTSYSGCECFEETYIVKKTITASQYPNEVVTIKANVGQLPTLDIGDVHFTSGPSAQTSTVLLAERITATTNYANDYSSTNVPLTSDIDTTNSGISEMENPSNSLSDIITLSSFGKISTSFFDADIINSTHISLNSENSLKYIKSSGIIDITISHVTSILFTLSDLLTGTTLSFVSSTTRVHTSNSLLSSINFDLSQTKYRTNFETLFQGTSFIKTDTLFSIPNVLSKTSSILTKHSSVLLTSISTSNVNFDLSPLSSIDVDNYTNELIGSTFEISDVIVERTYMLETNTTTTRLYNSYTSNSDIIVETEMANDESYFTRSETYKTNDRHDMSDTVRKAAHINASSEFSSQTPNTAQPIISTDTLVSTADIVYANTLIRINSNFLQTDSSASTMFVSTKQPFLSEPYTYMYQSKISLIDMTLTSSFLKSTISASDIEDEITTTTNKNSGYFSNIFKSSSIYASISKTSEPQLSMSDYLQSSFYPSEQAIWSRPTNYYVPTVQATSLFLVSSTDNIPSTVERTISTTNIIESGTQPSIYTLQNTEIYTIRNYSFLRTIAAGSDLDSTEVASTSEWDPSTAGYQLSKTDSSLMTAQSTLRNSFYSILKSSDSRKVKVSSYVPFSSVTSSTSFITKTVHSTNNTKAGLSETTKNVIFITIVSVVVVIIITVASIMLLNTVVSIERNKTCERKTDNASLSNDTQSVSKVFPEFPYKESSIYPRFFNTLSSSYMTSPYEQNWNKV